MSERHVGASCRKKNPIVNKTTGVVGTNMTGIIILMCFAVLAAFYAAVFAGMVEYETRSDLSEA